MRSRDKRMIKGVRSVLHIFCEGSKTEPNYIEHYKNLFCFGKSASIVVEKTEKTTPVQLVEEAVSLKNSSHSCKIDEFWVVYDRESPVKYDEKLHQKARKIASRNGINIALSNVCFEVWLLLHYQSTCAACNTCDELIRRRDFKTYFPSYEKGSECKMSKMDIMTARKNAVSLNKQTISGANVNWNEPSMWNPYTDMYKLLDAIDAFIARG